MTAGGMNTTRANRTIGAAILLLLILPGFLPAQDEVNADWTCRTCPDATGWDVDIDFGPAYVNDDAFAFGNYTGLDEKGGYVLGNVLGSYRDDEANYFRFEGYSRGENSSALFLEGGKQSLYELRASYQAIPRRVFDTSVTPYLGNGTDTLTLPAGWVRAPTTQTMTSLAGAAAPVNIGWDWDIYGLGFDLSPGQRWRFGVDYTRREKKGQARSAASFRFSAAEFASPIDTTTDDLEVALRFAADKWQTSLTYFGSLFRNQNSSLTWDNAYTAAPGVDTGRLALPPDNESHQVSLAGSVLLPARTTLNGQLSAGRMTQNDDLLPYTSNSLMAPMPLPTASANGEVDTLNLNIRAVSSPWRGVSLEGELRYNDFDNKTPVNAYDYVVTDTLPAGTPAQSTAYDYERRDIKLRGEYRLKSGMKFHAGFDNQRFDRSDQDRDHTTTNRLWFRFRTRIGDDADLDVDVFTEDRDGSTYTASANPAATENPLMRKYNMADRERSGIKFRGSILGTERSDFGLEFEYSDDSYDNSAIGLTGSRAVRLGADYSYAFARAGSAYASFYNEQIKTEQRNSQSFSTPDWSAETNDKFTTATLGVAYPELLGPVGASFEYNWSNSIGEIENDTSGLPTAFPDLRSTRQNVRLGLNYPVNDSWSVGFDYFFEDLRTDDWSLDGVNPDTVSNLMALGADAWNYDVSVFYLSVRYEL
jgi:MtrB/PioB family decaheme-associated outer membrane protein